MDIYKFIEETIESVLNAYIGQCLWSIILATVLFYFFSLYKRRHLRLWAYSWYAFAAYTIIACISLWLSSESDYDRFLVSILTFSYTLVSLLQVFWLLYGSYYLLRGRELSLRIEFFLYAILIVISIAFSVLFLYENEGGFIFSSLIPLAFKAFITGISFLLSGIMVMRTPGRNYGVGKRILWTGFVLIGLMNMHYFYKCLEIMKDPSVMIDFVFYLGVIDFVLLAVIGIGMVIWLLEQERSALLKSNRELDSFLYSTSHDLRAPVASLLGLINLARLDVKEKQALKYVNMMEERVRKLDHIFSDILNYSRNIKTEINPKVFRLGELIDDVISDVKFNEGADLIHLDYEEKVHHMLKTDYYQLKVILSNLISNAVKYHDSTKDNQFIAIRFSRLNSAVQIQVEDNGIGIARESQTRVFEMFYRASSEAEGSGLGLFIVKQALEKINASIKMESVLGEGTSFRIVIPEAAIKDRS